METSQREMLFFILMSSTELHTLNFWIWNSFSFNCFFLLLYFDLTWLHSHNSVTISAQNWCNSIPYVLLIPFHLLIRIFGLTFFLLSCTQRSIEPSFFYGNSRSTDQLIAFVYNRYCCCCCCSVFFFAVVRSVLLCVRHGCFNVSVYLFLILLFMR